MLDRGNVVPSGRAEMRRQQHVQTQFGIAGEPAFDDQDIAARIGGDAQPQRVALVRVHDLDRRYPRRQQVQRVVLVALDLRPEPARPGDDEAEIADLRDVDARPVDLVDDAEAGREPQPGGAQRGADHILGAARPGRRNPGSAGGVFG
jgi:hypothetical protein